MVHAYAPSATGDEIIGRFLAISAAVQKDSGVFDRIQRRTKIEAELLWRIFSLYPGREDKLWAVGRELLELFAQESQLNPDFVFRYGPDASKPVQHGTALNPGDLQVAARVGGQTAGLVRSVRYGAVKCATLGEHRPILSLRRAKG